MNRRKSIAISNKAYQTVKQFCPNCNISPFISDTILKLPINPDLADTPRHTYQNTGNRKLVQISLDAWKHLKKLEYSFIFEADKDGIPLNDIASIAILTVLIGEPKHEIHETTV